MSDFFKNGQRMYNEAAEQKPNDTEEKSGVHNVADIFTGKPRPKMNLRYRADGHLIADLANAVTILRHDERWCGVVALDEFQVRVIKLREPVWYDDDRPAEGPTSRDWSDLDTARFCTWLSRAYGMKLGIDLCHQAIRVAADGNRFHPIRVFLRSTKWDGVPRVGRFASLYLGAEDNEYTQRVMQWWLISAVARVEQPGCQADHVIILEGDQFIGKTNAGRYLAGPSVNDPSWFSEDLGQIGSVASFMSLLGKWIIEFGELSAMDRSEVNDMKQYISKRSDYYRTPYGRINQDVPRQCVFMGTTNDARYLRDPTGGRRFWPIKCTTIDLGAINRDRSQIWAEALHLYQSGEKWHPTQEQQETLCAPIQESRRELDPWQAVVESFLENRLDRTFVSTEDLFNCAIEMPVERRKVADTKRLAAVMTAMKWKSAQRRVNGKTTRGYVPDR